MGHNGHDLFLSSGEKVLRFKKKLVFTFDFLGLSKPANPFALFSIGFERLVAG